MPDEILTLPEVAQLLKVANKTVYTMAQQGELPSFKVRGQWRFRRMDIDAWMASQVAKTTKNSEAPPRPQRPRRARK
jgi:excisionase family DNA binding protein